MNKQYEKTVLIPKEVEISVENKIVILKLGEKTVEKKFIADEIKIEKNNEGIKISTDVSRKKSIAVINSIFSQISNLYSGLKQSFEYKLEIVYSHFPMNVIVKDNFVEISNLAGQKMPKKSHIIEQTQVVVKGKDIIVTSSNKEHAGQTAANMENATKIKGKDKRIFQDGIYIVSKPKSSIAIEAEKNE